MKIKEIKTLWRSKWLSIKKAVYEDKNNIERTWDYVERNNNAKVVTIICESESGKFLLIKQSRISINAFEISFPAGLIDPGEDVEQAALRELKEETWYGAEIVKYSDFTPKSSGLTNESTVVVFCKTLENDKGEQNLDPTEEIECFWISPDEFFRYIKKLDTKKIKISNDLYAFMSGLNYSNRNSR